MGVRKNPAPLGGGVVKGLFDVKTDKYKSIYDLSSKEYLLKEDDALVLHGKKKYITPENHRYLERKKAQSQF